MLTLFVPSVHLALSCDRAASSPSSPSSPPPVELVSGLQDTLAACHRLAGFEMATLPTYDEALVVHTLHPTHPSGLNEPVSPALTSMSRDVGEDNAPYLPRPHFISTPSLSHRTPALEPESRANWTTCWRRRCAAVRQPEPTFTTPEAEYRQGWRRNLWKSSFVLFVVTGCMAGAIVGLSESIKRLKAGVTFTSPDDDGSDEKAQISRSPTHLYLTAFFVLLLFVTLLCLYRCIGRCLQDLVAVRSLPTSAPGIAGERKPSRALNFLLRIFDVGQISLHPPKLPTYQTAVKQGVIRRTRNRNIRTEGLFARMQNRSLADIDEEEVELERIRKMGGPAPTYPSEGVADRHITAPAPARLTLRPPMLQHWLNRLSSGSLQSWRASMSGASIPRTDPSEDITGIRKHTDDTRR